ncbi:MAG: MoaD/ThiS family protein [Anaerolineales bacterium]|nr:MoaD/ThiS family protein [Anaerolineales bacterium]
MVIAVRVSAGLAQELGGPRFAVTLREGATVADLLAVLRAQHPAVARLAIVLPIVAGQYVGAEHPLTPDTEVALLLPAAGGAGSSPTPRRPHDR